MEADLVVAHTSQRLIREEATNTGKRKRCILQLRQKIQHDHMRMMHGMARCNTMQVIQIKRENNPDN